MSEAYREYLASPPWRMRAAIMVEIADGACEYCGQDYDLQVHHVSYRSQQNEEPTDLVVLCRRCHRRVHGRSDAETIGLDELLAIADRHPRTFAEYTASDYYADERFYEETGIG